MLIVVVNHKIPNCNGEYITKVFFSRLIGFFAGEVQLPYNDFLAKLHIFVTSNITH